MASVAPLVNTTSRGRAPKSAGDLLARFLDGGARHAPLGVDPARVGGPVAVSHASIASTDHGSRRRRRRVVEVGAASRASSRRR